MIRNSYNYGLDSSYSFIKSNLRERRNNTTVYTVATVGYVKNVDKKKKQRFRIIAITKTNRGTCTDNTTNLVNNSTMTTDVWNPVVDRRDKSISLVKDRALMVRTRLKRKDKQSESVHTHGRVATFRSSTQIIPNGPGTAIYLRKVSIIIL